MDAKELFKQALASASSAIQMATPADYNRPTPDTEWDLDTLACHVLYELSWTADILRGATIGEVGDKYDGDLMGDDLQAAWAGAADAALRDLEICDLESTAHLSYGDVTNEDYLREAASDQLIHSWDLSAALGRPVQFDQATAEAIYRDTVPKKRYMAASGLFKTPLEVPESADIQTKLLALFGRDAKWKAPHQTNLFK